MWAAYRGLTHWQSIPSTWDAVWHANEVRFILDTGQASSTHMGELRNVETHQALYYPSVFHALTAVFCQLTGAAPTTGYTLSSVAASVWLFPSSAAMLTWHLLRRVTHRSGAPREWRPPRRRCRRRSPRCPTSSSASPRCPTWRPTGSRCPTFVLITSTLRHRDRIPAAVLALVGRAVGAPHRRVRRHPVPVGLVAAGRVVASGARPARRRADPGGRGRADAADPGAAVPRGAQAGRHHRRACVPQLQERRSRASSTRCCCTPATSTTFPIQYGLRGPVGTSAWRSCCTRGSGGRPRSGWC